MDAGNTTNSANPEKFMNAFVKHIIRMAGICHKITNAPVHPKGCIM